jgi:hypothetical protein
MAGALEGRVALVAHDGRSDSIGEPADVTGYR